MTMGASAPVIVARNPVAQLRTKSPVWEQYLVTDHWLRTHGFRGQVAVYPYFDTYEPKLDPFLPADLRIVGHGSGAAARSRDYEFIGPMGDTWIDNLYANFRVVPSPRNKRLWPTAGVSGSGRCLCRRELPWESIGFLAGNLRPRQTRSVFNGRRGSPARPRPNRFSR